MREWIWLQHDVVLAIHEEQLAEHGGGAGIRDAGLLDSALARPQNTAAYKSPDAADLAAAYAYGLSRNHPFMDGNKRTGFVALELFLQLNGHELQATDTDCVLAMLTVAAGDITEAQLADWVRRHMKAA
ncbi:type II toxin-antitoxin system death-on-curing family toxin [Ramlibacter henchirensis]|uniref:Type II toxin-antitoxin system death-on-curing family toxin n=1 Tax=Ramlibacter henchirensis TaxID=204072 RepID=A0A4Z0C4Z5_9BURK|nr:type II toxin-antitoxin system death-on-curing family toxin [Ramlibacter henchirensis]TFZ06014.1 type II toxin-antitoxin system death-on-curing family toxin [Ramlibacter henchirensis]